jgi:hypothetical protein
MGIPAVVLTTTASENCIAVGIRKGAVGPTADVADPKGIGGGCGVGGSCGVVGQSDSGSGNFWSDLAVMP